MLLKNNKHTSNISCGDQRKQLYSHLLQVGITNLTTGCIKAISIKTTNDTSTQVYKVACANTPTIRAVLDGLPKLVKLDYLVLLDVDVTRDYKGSFDRAKLVLHLLNCGFVQEGCASSETHDSPTIVHPKCGNNCLTYMDTFRGHTIRSKIYNKFAQCLESGSVRSTVGTHLWHWISNPEKRLRESISKALDAGLTRTEVTFYGRIPDLDDIETVLNRWPDSFLPSHITYKTPISKQWESFVGTLKRNLIVYSPSTGEVLLAHWINSQTKKIGGFIRKITDERHLGWIVTELTLCLPTDVFYIDWRKNEDKIYCGIRSFHKASPNLDTRTRLIEGSYIYKTGTTQLADNGISMVNGIGFNVFCNRATVTSKYRYNVVEQPHLDKPSLLSEKELLKMLLSDVIKQQHLDHLREVTNRKHEFQQEQEANKSKSESRRKEQIEAISRNLTVALRRKFTKEHVGSSFDILGITEYNGGIYGKQFLLATRFDSVYYSDPYSRRVLDDKLKWLHSNNVIIIPYKSKGTTIWIHKNCNTIYTTISVVQWLVTRQKNYYAHTTHKWSLSNPVDDAAVIKSRVDELQTNHNNIQTLQRFTYTKPITKAIKLESVTPMVGISVYAISTVVHR